MIKNLEIVLVVSIFLPVVMDAIYQQTPDELSSLSFTIKWGLVIAVLLVDYLILTNFIFNKKITAVIKNTFAVNIGALAIILGVIAYAPQTVSFPLTIILGAALFCSTLIPLFVFLIAGLYLLYNELYKDIFSQILGLVRKLLRK